MYLSTTRTTAFSPPTPPVCTVSSRLPYRCGLQSHDVLPTYRQINHLTSVAGQTDVWIELRDRKIHAKTINLSKGESACIIHSKFDFYLEGDKTGLYSLTIRGVTKVDAATISKADAATISKADAATIISKADAATIISKSSPRKEILRLCWC